MGTNIPFNIRWQCVHSNGVLLRSNRPVHVRQVKLSNANFCFAEIEKARVSVEGNRIRRAKRLEAARKIIKGDSETAVAGSETAETPAASQNSGKDFFKFIFFDIVACCGRMAMMTRFCLWSF